MHQERKVIFQGGFYFPSMSHPLRSFLGFKSLISLIKMEDLSMTDADLMSRFKTDLVQRVARQRTVPERHYLSVSPWVAMSLLQKAIRRGRTDFALIAAATLLRDAPDRLWRRLAIIAFEEIGRAHV
jgi:replication-associated recombination protein RarA